MNSGNIGKKSSNRRIIESETPKKEHFYVKFTGEEIVPATEKHRTHGVTRDKNKVLDLQSDRILRKGSLGTRFDIHTHPDRQALPGLDDLEVMNDTVKDSRYVEVIAARDKDSRGTLAGYTMIFQKRRPNKGRTIPEKLAKYYSLIRYGIGSESEFEEKARKNAINELTKYTKKNFKDEKKVTHLEKPEYFKQLKKTLRKAGLDIRFHAARGYYFDENTGNYERSNRFVEHAKNYERSNRTLEGAVASIILGAIFIVIFLKAPITGAAISPIVSSKFGFGFIILGILSFAFLIYLILKLYKKYFKKQEAIKK